MLVELHVVDLGIVAEVDLVLTPGLTAITGETGAGKTLLVEAVELLAGGRADPAMVREGAAEARIEGRFVDGAGDEVVLARVVPRDGRSRAYVDGRLATATELAERGAALLDLHGQHAHQSFLQPAVQRAALDRYAGPDAGAALDEYRAARAEARDVERFLAALGGDERARARELDLLRFQVEELARAGLDDAEEDATLAHEEDLLADAAAHGEALARAYESLEGPAMDGLGAALTALDGRAPFAALTERIRGLHAEVADVEAELRMSAEVVSEDPERLDAVRRRRQLLHELQRKYGDSVSEVIAYAAELDVRVTELEGYEARAAELDARGRAVEQQVVTAASRLSAARRRVAEPLARAVEEHLHDLAMPHAQMKVEVTGAERTDDGADDVVFLLAPNPGEPLRPLARAASGGELSRAMLAVRVVLTAAPPTLVFDEVDAGIGGAAGTAVGRLLATLGTRHQVLCVTHLAQVAAFADTQVVVEKVVEPSTDGRSGNRSVGRGERTVAHAEVVDGAERVAELSRMLAGLGDSATARDHAAELLATATSERGRWR